MTTEYETISVESRDQIAYVKLNRAQKRNAINARMIAELGAVFGCLPADARVVILHAEGEHFSAGLDLIERLKNRTADPLGGIRNSRSWQRVFDLIEHGDVPVISVLKGGVIGGGLEMAATTHVRVCEETAYFQLPEGQRGIFVGGGASVRVSRIIGAGRVAEMMLTGRTFDVNEGYTLGLGHYVVPDGQGMAKAEALARSIISNSPISNFAIINAISHISEMGSNGGFFAESLMATVTARASDSKERITQFFDDRRRTRQERETRDGQG